MRPRGTPPESVDDNAHKSRLFALCCGVPEFKFRWTDSLMTTALRLKQLHPDWWRVYVENNDLDDETLRRVYGVE